jgi:acyl-CoA thioesterase I
VWVWINRDHNTITNNPPKNSTIVAFGDSLVEGVGSVRGGGFVSITSEKLGIPIRNMGIRGNTTADGLTRIAELRNIDPGIVVILLGGNDALRNIPPDETFKNLRSITTTLQSDGTLVVLLGIRGAALRDPYSERFERLARETGSVYVENVLKGLLGRPEYMDDAIHPNDIGYSLIADRVVEVLKPFIAQGS